MNLLIVSLGFASLLLSSAALAQSAGEKTGVNSVLGIAPKTEDFIKEAAMSDLLEIEAGKIAQDKGNADEKKFAAEMVTDHTKTSTELKAMISGEMKAALPTMLDDTSQKKLGKLRDSKPDDFASEYDPMQVSAHKDAVSLFERYSKGGEDPKLKDWAGKTLPALQHHLEMAQKSWKNEVIRGWRRNVKATKQLSQSDQLERIAYEGGSVLCKAKGRSRSARDEGRDRGVGALLTSLSYIPKIGKVWPSGSTGDLSLKMLVVLTTGLVLWDCYGLLREDWIIVLANSVGALLSETVLLCKLRDIRSSSKTF